MIKNVLLAVTTVFAVACFTTLVKKDRAYRVEKEIVTVYRERIPILVKHIPYEEYGAVLDELNDQLTKIKFDQIVSNF